MRISRMLSITIRYFSKRIINHDIKWRIHFQRVWNFYCSQLSSVTFEPDSKLKTIGGYCDGNWSSEVGTKHYGAFADCEALTNIELPASLTAINSVAFSNCRKLIDVYCTALTPPTIKTGSSGTFTNISSAARFYVPLESVDAYKAATGWEKYANQIVGYNFTE